MKHHFHHLIRLNPDNFTHNVWGGKWIPRWKNLAAGSNQRVGESWEFSGHPAHPNYVKTGPREFVSLRHAVARWGREILGKKIIDRQVSQIPFLLKFIDARGHLSLQVHPPMKYAEKHENDFGKFEGWFILDTGTGRNEGFIYLGFAPKYSRFRLTPDQRQESFYRAIDRANGLGPSSHPSVRKKAAHLVLPFVNKIRVHPGDVYCLEPGTIHLIGAGVRLFEIQQPSDLTYRVWDWNRPDPALLKKGIRAFRPLHLKKAFDVLHFKPKSPSGFKLKFEKVACQGHGKISEEIWVHKPEFSLAATKISLEEKSAYIDQKTGGRFFVLTAIQGRVSLFEQEKKEWRYAGDLIEGFSVLVPATLAGVRIQSETSRAQLIKSYVP